MNDADPRRILGESYAAIAELWCGEPDVDPARARLRAQALLPRLHSIAPEGATALARFLDGPPIDEQEYVDLFELQPRCPLYLGSHVFDEPKTCAGAAVSDRNDYMIELLGVYGHFGRTPNGRELPDYLPLVVDFLASTVGSSDDPVRTKFLVDYVLPFLPHMKKRLQEIGTPYAHLMEALERILHHELEANHHVE
jgi:nitrate reductase delta subunit